MELQLALTLLLGVATLAVGRLLHWFYKWTYPTCNGTLPPGSMGLPLVGETIQFFRRSPLIDISDFFKERSQRYGSLFKTSMLGNPMIVSMDAEINRFIFQQEGTLFQTWYPRSVSSLLGKDTLARNNDGSFHKFVRCFATQQCSVQNLRDALIGDMEKSVKGSLATWATEPSIDVRDVVENMVFDIIARKLIGVEPTKSKEMMKNFKGLPEVILMLPLYIPGTKFYRCVQAMKNVHKVLQELLQERLTFPEKRYGGLLDAAVEELQRNENSLVDENSLINLIAGLMFASFSTIPSALTMAVKFLTDNPSVLEALTAEHEAFLKGREDMNSAITWEEYKSMKFTTMVTNEILRLSNIGVGVFRVALKDVHLNGYTIPAGWLVMINPVAIHLNPKLYEDPLTFNPWRWQEPKGTALRKNLIPFGDGKRLCVGAEFSKLEIALFLHTLVTKYRWEELKGGVMFRKAGVLFSQDYCIRLFPRV